ncbi:hypothetical protein J2S36_000550 [Arcanobacterium hippocoleae]|uniref:Uncharacterized protein n=1 Tax=Arcanobacterium hippocoleae TaxID=149017 RepID=A0ABU1T0W4_9ACTO|nr:hypothetical protein [Arcanobacterium hippocoleae]
MRMRDREVRRETRAKMENVDVWDANLKVVLIRGENYLQS